jgi:PAS domain S-box-containing protein/putative nucleotidyltransferase with HDIG domain
MKTNSWTILCVDDVPENLYAYEILLGKVDHVNVLCASSGEIALKIVLREKVDLILLDIQMPGMDGYEVATLLKSNQSTRNIPIIFITAVFKQEEFIAKGFELGAVDYMTKPLDDNLLMNRLRLYLNVFSEKQNAQDNLQMFYDITQGIGDGLYVVNTKGTLDFINDTALDMLGYTRQELQSLPIHDLIHAHDKAGKRQMAKDCPVLQTFHTKKVKIIKEDVLRCKNGAILPVTTIASPIVKNETVIAVVCLFRDITNELEYQSIQKQRLTSKNEMILMFIEAVDKRDPYTAGHTQRVATYCELIAKDMGYSQIQIEMLVGAAHLHDIGKIATPDSVLLKPGHFDEAEYEIMKQHLETGFELINNIQEYHEIAELMRYHHERYDGKGYPLGLSGNAIPPIARIMILADAFDAMTTNRIYKKRKSVKEALHEITELSEIQFHPEVVESAIRVLSTVVIGDYLDQRPHNALEEKRFAYFYHDRLSGCYSIDYLPIVLDTYYPNEDVHILKINLHNMNEYNATHGWEKGNQLLAIFSQHLREQCPERFTFRISGDDFIIISENGGHIDTQKMNNFLSTFDIKLSVSVTSDVISQDERDYEKLLELLHR